MSSGDAGGTAGRALSPEAAAAYLGVVTPKTLANWRSMGIGPRFVRLGKGGRAAVAYRVGHLNAWLDEQLVDQAQPN